MALTAEQRFDALVPAFAAHPSKAVYLEMAEERTAPVSACGWNEAKRAQAVALRAAHTMTLALDPLRAGGSGGQIQQKREGDLSISFGGGSSSSRPLEDLEQTSFGIQLKSLVSSSFLLFGTTAEDDCDGV